MVKSIGPNRKEKKSLGDLSYVRKGDIVHSWGQPKYCITLFFHCNTFADERLSADQIILREFNQMPLAIYEVDLTHLIVSWRH